MDEAASDVWREIDYDTAWAPFNERFAFEPNYHERRSAPIRVPDGALVLDLAPVFEGGARFGAGQAAVNAAALRAFVRLSPDEDLVALDWNHSAHRYSPGRLASRDPLEWVTPVFPNGDYYAHVPVDLTWGTFGHPWQEWLCVWGEPLVTSLGAELLTWLPRHAHSRA